MQLCRFAPFILQILKLLWTSLIFSLCISGNEDPSGKLRPEIVDEVGERYATVILKAVTNIQVEHATKIKTALEKVQDSVKGLIEIYIKSFRVNFSMNSNYQEKETKETIETYETFLAKIFALHRIPVDWNHDEYQVCLQVYHGTRPIMDPSKSLFQSKSDGFFPRVVFDQFLGTESVQICGLPREARLVLTLFARDVITEDKQRKLVTKELGWASLQLFDFQRHLCQGTFLLNLWPSTGKFIVILRPFPDLIYHFLIFSRKTSWTCTRLWLAPLRGHLSHDQFGFT